MKEKKFGRTTDKSHNNSKKYYLISFVLGIIFTLLLVTTVSQVFYDFQDDQELLIEGEDLLSADELNEKKDSTVVVKSGREQGTGFFINEEGYIVTNEHVLVSPESTEITKNGLTLEAEFIGKSEKTDIGVLKIDSDSIEKKPLETAEYTPKRTVPLSVIGAPENLPNTITEGQVTNNKRLLSVNGNIIPKGVQFDATVNRGNSGGPIIDKRNGKVIGIVRSQEEEGINFGLGSSVVDKVYNDIVNNDGYNHSTLYTRTEELNKEKLNEFRLDEKEGVLLEVTEQAEIIEEEHPDRFILTEIGTSKIDNSHDLAEFLFFETEPGDLKEITIINKKGEREKYNIRIKE